MFFLGQIFFLLEIRLRSSLFVAEKQKCDKEIEPNRTSRNFRNKEPQRTKKNDDAEHFSNRRAKSNAEKDFSQIERNQIFPLIFSVQKKKKIRKIDRDVAQIGRSTSTHKLFRTSYAEKEVELIHYENLFCRRISIRWKFNWKSISKRWFSIDAHIFFSSSVSIWKMILSWIFSLCFYLDFCSKTSKTDSWFRLSRSKMTLYSIFIQSTCFLSKTFHQRVTVRLSRKFRWERFLLDRVSQIVETIRSVFFDTK